ncbi:MAG TPA: hypothetical protein VOA87_00490 [Thermoanaerobaculia bacterium]|nr:hypothetical protein [Thermoanaerobaculia bacterium]
MSAAREREIARRLAAGGDAEPPAGLLARIQSEIPPEVAVGTQAPNRRDREPAAPRKSWRPWLLAASLVMTIGASFLALRVMRIEPLQKMESRALARHATAGKEAFAPAPQISRSTPAIPPPPRPSPLMAPAAPQARADAVRNQTARSFAAQPKAERSFAVAPREERSLEAAQAAPGGAAGETAPEEALLDAAKPAGAPPPSPGGVAGGFAGPREKSLDKQAYLEGSARLARRVDGASFDLARRSLEAGQLPPPAAIRVEDFLAAVDPGDAGETGVGSLARQRVLSGLPLSWDGASPALRILSVAAELARVLQVEPAERASRLPELLRRARSLRAVAGGRPEVAEMVTMVERTASIAERGKGVP